MVTLNIETEKLKIRNLKPTDLKDFYIYRSNPEVTAYQGFATMNLVQAGDFINEQKDKLFGEAGEWVQYGIENKSTKRIIGDCAIKLDQNEKRIAEIGITISHLEQRKGYAKETITGILNYLFDKIDIHRVVAIADTENTASILLFERLGFRREGHFIENIFFKGKWGSEIQFALLKREWVKLTNND